MLRPVVKINKNMKLMRRNHGSAFLIVVFIIALLAAVVMGMLQINTEEIQIMRNQIYAADAMAVAEAGLNDAFYEIRSDISWVAGFTDKAFNGGSYTVVVGGAAPSLTITSTGTSSQGYVGRVDAEITVGTSSPHIIKIDTLRFNNN
jgi:Tfp pilus assembly protein PilX